MTIAAPISMLGGFNLWDFTRAVKASDLPPVERHLLHVMALTPAKGSDGTCAGPDFSYQHLADATGYSRRWVITALRAAEQAGWLVKLPGGRGKRNSYRLALPRLSTTGAPSSPVEPDQCTGFTSTSALGSPDQCTGFTPDLSLPLLTKIPSIVEGVRARVRAVCPDLQPDDDDLAALIQNLETRPRKPVRNVAAYLQTCPPADIRRLLAEANQPPAAPPATPTPPRPDDPAEPDCVHGNPGGLTSAGTPRCPRCRRIAAQLTDSQPFTASLDEGDRTPAPRAAESLSEPIPVAVTA